MRIVHKITLKITKTQNQITNEIFKINRDHHLSTYKYIYIIWCTKNTLCICLIQRNVAKIVNGLFTHTKILKYIFAAEIMSNIECEHIDNSVDWINYRA